MRVLLILVLASLLAIGTYLGLERLGRRALIPMLARAVAWAALGLLLVNVSCPRPPVPQEPLVLLDASLSMGVAGSDWDATRATAESLGEVRFIGDERPGTDSTPDRGRSRLAPAVMSALALDRPIVVVTDGEVEDAGEIPADARRELTIVARPRSSARDLAIVEVSGPDRLTTGDSIRVEATVRSLGEAAGRDSVTVELVSDDARRTLLSSRTARLANGEARVVLRSPSAQLTPGDHILTIRLKHGGDAEPRTDERLLHLHVAETPGVVLVASPADWDARFLFRTVRDVSALPVRGYVQLGDRWWSMHDLKPVTDEAVRRAIRGADLLILKGRAVERAGEGRARGTWLWPGGTGGENGDWYLTPTPVSPLSPAFAGLPVDSFPPAVQLTPIQPLQGGWVALMAQAGRRGAPRAAMAGQEGGRRRQVTTAVEGLWRWSFRGASAEQGYRALVATTVSWLLGSPDSARGLARPLRRVAENGRPVVFEWSGTGAPRPVGITWSSGASTRTDSLRFDGAGRALAWLAPGTWRYRLEEGAGGLVAVEQWSGEFLPRPVTLTSQQGIRTPPASRSAARDRWWLFAIGVAALCVEWWYRRKLGLR